MKSKLITQLTLSSLTSLSLLTACQPDLAPTTTLRPPATVSAALDPLELTGTVKLLQSTGGHQLQISLPGLNQGFKTQAIGCGSITSLTITVTGFGISMPSTLTGTATPTTAGSCQFTTGILPSIPVGKARIVTITANSAAGVAAEIKAAVDITNGTNTSFEVSYRSHMVARVIEELTQKGAIGKVYSTRQNLSDLQTWIDTLTTFNTGSVFPNYTYVRHPMLLKPDVLAQAIIDNQAAIPATPPANYLKTPASVQVAITNASDTGIQIDLRDPTSAPFSQGGPSPASLNHIFTNVIPGTWRLRIFNDTEYSQTVTVGDGQSTTVNVNLAAATVPTVDWSRWSVPRAGYVVGMARDGASMIYAGTKGGVYQYSGSNWQAVNQGLPANFEVSAIAGAPDQHVFVVLSDNKVYRRDFSSASVWTEVGTSPYPTIPATMIYVDPENNNQIFVGTSTGQVSRCTNALGATPTWSQVLDDGSVGAIQDMVKDVNVDRYYIATNSGGIRGTSSFTGWTPHNGGLLDNNIKALYFNSAQNVLMAGGNNGNVYTSSIPVTTWIDRGNVGTVRDIVQSGSAPNHPIYVTTTNSLKKAIDNLPEDGVPDGAFVTVDPGGNPFPPTAPMNPNLTAMALDGSGFPMVGTEGAGVNYWTGSNWTDVNSGLNAATINALVPAPASSEFFAGTDGSGVHRLVNDAIGEPMLNMALNGNERYVTSLAIQVNTTTPGTYNLFAGTKGAGLWVVNAIEGTSQPSVAWAQVGSLPGANINSLLLQDGLALYAGTDTSLYKTTCITATCNSGSSWTQVTDAGINTPTGIFSVAMRPSSPNHLYAGSTGRVYVSTDGGSNWTAPSVGMAVQKVLTLATLPTGTSTAADDVVYAGLDAQGGLTTQVWKSVNGGGTFTAMSNPSGTANVNALVVDPSNVNTVYAGTSNGVYVSINGGSSWTPINNSFTGSDLTGIEVVSLMIKGGNLYAGTRNHSVYVTALSACSPCV